MNEKKRLIKLTAKSFIKQIGIQTIMENRGEILLYQSEDGTVKIDVRMENETVWLSQKSMAELFQTTVPNINIHLKNIFDEGELDPNRTIKDFLIVRLEGKREVNRKIDFYNLDAIISVGYRIKSHVATKFRIWATLRLKEYIIKGFTLDDERMKAAGQIRYFDELQERIRDIRSSERIFYQKIKDILPSVLTMKHKPRWQRIFLLLFRINYTGQYINIPQPN